MHEIDPFEPEDPTFECPSCGARAQRRGRCDGCGEQLLNITVPRE